MASIGFRWLDILEKEFDKAFVDLDLTISELESDEPSLVFNVRQKLCTLSSCFAQLTHKSQTIFQNSAKIEAELVHMRAELTESKSKREVLETELHHLLLQLHSSQLSRLPDTLGNKRQDQYIKPDVSAIKQKLEAEIRQSPLRGALKDAEELKFSPSLLEPAQYKASIAQLQSENAALRNELLALTGDVYGAKLAAKYLDKELAGRIQQLQLLGREMRGDVRDKLWRQLESEILLQRHKTVVKACRRNRTMNGTNDCSKPVTENDEHFGDIRSVLVKRKPDQGLGISITGGREHGVPILISELESNGPAALSEQLYIGDAILSVNDIDLRNLCHREAVDILQQQQGDCTLQVQYIAADDSDNSLEEDGFNFRFFDENVCDSSNANNCKSTEDIANTPTAPRTPESSISSRSPRKLIQISPERGDSIETGDIQNARNIRNNNARTLADNKSNNNRPQDAHTDGYVDTNDLVLVDNATNNVIKLENFKMVDVLATIEDNYNTSTNSLNSDNLSSPMQTSTDVYVDSEIASNDSRSPKNPQAGKFEYESSAVSAKSDLSKSDQSLLNSDSSGSSPVRDYKKQKKHRKKYFGVKTLQSIFNKRDGYSDVSTTASELGEEQEAKQEPGIPSLQLADVTSPQFEENIHNLLSDIFVKRFPLEQAVNGSSKGCVNPNVGPKKYFSLHGQNLRVGKALRLCPNEDLLADEDVDLRKEKLLARYVYNTNSSSADGVGDPDFGTPV